MAVTNVGYSGNIAPQSVVTTPASATTGAGLNIPAGTAPTTPNAGDVWNDTTQKNIATSVLGGAGVAQFLASIGAGCALPAQTANTTITTIQVMGTLPLGTAYGAGFLNAVGKTLLISGAGVYSTTAGQTPQITITIKIGTVVVCAIQSAATTASATNMPFNFQFEIITAATGATGTVEAHGILSLTLGTTPAAACATYIDTNTAVSAAIDLTAAPAITINITAAGTTLSSATLRQAFAVLAN